MKSNQRAAVQGHGQIPPRLATVLLQKPRDFVVFVEMLMDESRQTIALLYHPAPRRFPSQQAVFQGTGGIVALNRQGYSLEEPASAVGIA